MLRATGEFSIVLGARVGVAALVTAALVFLGLAVGAAVGGNSAR
jgi:hypothetical protein